MRKHRLDRRQRKKQNKLIIFSMIGIVCLFSIGYATFSQNFLISGKGTIIEKPITIEDLKLKKVTSGDGLYQDIYEEGRYIYRGAGPNNYITFNNELWRIMSVEADGTLKIIRDESIGKMKWDEASTRDSSTSTYCIYASTYGCAVWASTSNLIGTPSTFILHSPNGNTTTDTQIYSRTVVQDSSLNTYLNTTYYDGIGDDKKYIVSHNFNVGTPGNNSDIEDMSANIAQESLYKWQGKIGLMDVLEILRTTSNTNCLNLNIGNNNYQSSVCSENNWLWPKSDYIWIISPFPDEGCSHVWGVDSGGYIGSTMVARDTNGVLPVVYLKSGITLAGHGTENNPYTIVNK